jgi:F-type H+-transporting ATPase subunit epsilon
MKLLLEIITPLKVIFKEEVDEVTLPTVNGEISILPNHVDLLTKIAPGEMVVKIGSKTDVLAITGGFLEISKNHVTILADYAVRAADIEVARAQQAQERAQKAMKEKTTDKDFIIAEGELRKAILEQKVARKHRSSGKPQ